MAKAKTTGTDQERRELIEKAKTAVRNFARRLTLLSPVSPAPLLPPSSTSTTHRPRMTVACRRGGPSARAEMHQNNGLRTRVGRRHTSIQRSSRFERQAFASHLFIVTLTRH